VDRADLPGGGWFALTNFTDEKPIAAGGTIAFEVEGQLRVTSTYETADPANW
jgi:hypothetical protein